MDNDTCSVDGCDKRRLAKGMCSGHYQRRLKSSPLGDDVPLIDTSKRAGGKCAVAGCVKPLDTKGLCVGHYGRLLAKGDVRADVPLISKRRSMSPRDRVLADSTMTESGCLEITPTLRGPAGYGNVSVGGRTKLAHRIVWEHANGTVPAGLVVRHRCDNPSCVLIDHLEVGTQGDNIRDSFRRGRR